MKQKTSLGDLMVLVAATAVGLGGYLMIDDRFYRGQRYLFGVFQPHQGAWSSGQVLSRLSGVVSILMIAFGAWTFAVPVLTWLRPRPIRLRLARGAGCSACVATCVGMASSLAVTALLFLGLWADGGKPLPPNFWNVTPIFDNLIIFPGVAITAVWSGQWINRRWRPLPTLLDRVGRLMGLLWIFSAMVFAVRLMLR